MDPHSPQKWFNLEEQFYKSLDAHLLDKLRDQANVAQTAESIMKLTGITDNSVASRIAELKVSPETLAAFGLVPMVAVAWADDHVQADEKYVIEQAARAAGLNEHSQALLSGWLKQRPGSELFDTWCAYAKSLAGSLNEAERTSLQKNLLAQATAVAKATGGFLGIAAISAGENAVLDKIKASLS